MTKHKYLVTYTQDHEDDFYLAGDEADLERWLRQNFGFGDEEFGTPEFADAVMNQIDDNWQSLQVFDISGDQPVKWSMIMSDPCVTLRVPKYMWTGSGSLFLTTDDVKEIKRWSEGTKRVLPKVTPVVPLHACEERTGWRRTLKGEGYTHVEYDFEHDYDHHHDEIRLKGQDDHWHKASSNLKDFMKTFPAEVGKEADLNGKLLWDLEKDHITITEGYAEYHTDQETRVI